MTAAGKQPKREVGFGPMFDRLDKYHKHRNDYATRYHRDGTVTLWDVYGQRWTRVDARYVRDEVLASLSDDERSRIAQMAAKIGGAS